MSGYATAQAVPVAAQAMPQEVQATLIGGNKGPSSQPSKYPEGNELNDGAAREYLSQHGWPVGLQNVFVQNLNRIPFRFYICDDSGSMATTDGHKLVDSPTGKRLVKCSRWDELSSSLKFLAGAAKAASAPTEFRMLNGSAPILIGADDADDTGRYQTLQAVLNEGPGGGTPLCRHIREVVADVRAMEQQLRAHGQKACVLIASDGEASDGNVAEAMQPLKDLPVWVLVRLCTDDDRVVQYWNNIDSELELEMDVLDDFSGEAKELFAKNPWLTYGEPLHRLREFGIPVKDVDLMDESKLSLAQIRKVCMTIFGGSDSDFPHPEADFTGFVAATTQMNQKCSDVWDPISLKMKSWVNVPQLKRANGKGGKCAIM